MEEKRIHWTEIFGNPYRFSLHPSMLTEQGYEMRLVTKIKGESRYIDTAVVVKFDESYVIEYIARTLEKLQPQKYNDWQKIVSKAYSFWDNKKKQVQQ
ncbi:MULTISPECIES: hypothetical protein [unclassified Nostoc]|uniref:hypothetical protein n=1 Tax=unclassified Nostoc TaxID=2593658 RepID=UPI002AD3168F|nr:hypothetical protein [Nostoc sp. DedSLP03]